MSEGLNKLIFKIKNLKNNTELKEQLTYKVKNIAHSPKGKQFYYKTSDSIKEKTNKYIEKIKETMTQTKNKKNNIAPM